ncbi:hypothetical protein ADENT20671_1402 [Actinomyces denticolens]|nr:hypothetical protein ADENT20671_1402 [Actinomyces denticolens]
MSADALAEEDAAEGARDGQCEHERAQEQARATAFPPLRRGGRGLPGRRRNGHRRHRSGGPNGPADRCSEGVGA